MKGRKTSRTNSDINEKHRELAVWRIMELCVEKEYKVETMFLAINILDRFLANSFGCQGSSSNSQFSGGYILNMS